MPSDDDDEAYDGPDAYLDGDDNVLELEIDQDNISARSEDPGSTAIAQILRCKCLFHASQADSHITCQHCLTFSSCSLAAPPKGRLALVRLTTRGIRLPIVTWYVYCGLAPSGETKMRKTKMQAMTTTNIQPAHIGTNNGSLPTPILRRGASSYS